ncbi:MAG: T4SS-associated protein EirA [Pseudomonadota bacterium]|nr:T4SS-associated protein EirA [Pseudomonadota bacterium]
MTSYLLLACFLFTQSSYAQLNTPVNNRPTSEPSEPTENSVCPYAYQPGASFCPQISELFLDKDNFWQSKDDWKANEPSFSDKLTKFVGVQWKGVNIGRITCIYKGPSAREFPVSLYKNIIINNPSNLTDNTRTYMSDAEKEKIYKPNGDDRGVMNCFSANNTICDCPFVLYEKPRESSEKIIFSIEKINGESLPFLY